MLTFVGHVARSLLYSVQPREIRLDLENSETRRLTTFRQRTRSNDVRTPRSNGSVGAWIASPAAPFSLDAGSVLTLIA